MVKVNTRRILLSGALLGALTACGTNMKKASFPSDMSPSDVMASLDRNVQQGYETQADVLAAEPFNKGLEYYSEAREEMNETDMEADEFREEAGYSKAFLQKAIGTAKTKMPKVEQITSARKAALDAGVREVPELADRFKEIDDDVRSASGNFSKELDPKEYSSLQKRYLELEVLGTQNGELGRAKDLLAKAVDDGAESKAPETLRKVRKSFKTSENTIRANVNNPAGYETQVLSTLADTITLSDIMTAINSRGGDVKESVGVELVKNDRKINDLNSRAAALRTHVGVAHAGVKAMGSELESKSRKVRFQQAMEEVRSGFSKDEAEVYQQGDKLIIRLKQINFPVGKAAIPQEAKPLLSKVNSIVSKVEPAGITVQGHTDSTGSKELNNTLSQKRAQSVATFFKGRMDGVSVDSKGLGSSQPLAANSSKEGRALNRRVDIVVNAKK